MVDREAIESMLRVYGPPAKEVPTFRPPNLVRKKDISLLPYLTAVATNWKETSGNKRGITGGTTRQVNDGEYHGQFKCAVRCIFVLWNNEQVIEPQRSFPGHGKIWGDNEILYEAPSSH